jgi:hypothetical protein
MSLPIQTLRDMWDAAGERDWTRDLGLHLLYGVVYSTPEVFVMGRPVRWSDGEAVNLDIARPCLPCEDCDTWMVWAAAGEHATEIAMQIAPVPLPYVAWHREGGPLRRWKWERVHALTTGGNNGKHESLRTAAA